MGGKASALVELMRPRNLILAALTVPLGAHFGITGAWSTSDVFAVGVQVLTVLTFMGAGNAMNDIKDAAIDATAHPARPLPSGRVTISYAKRFVVILWIISFSSMLVGAWWLYQSDLAWWPLMVIYLLAVALMLTYDLGPQTKAKGLVGNVAISLMVAAVIGYGASTVGRISALVAWIALVVFFTNLAREIIKDCQDMLADEGERTTLPMKIGQDNARMVAYIMIMAGLVCLYIPYWQGPFTLNQLLFQTPAILVLITLNGPLYKGEDAVVGMRIRIAMLLGVLGFVLTQML
ncbi:UbiA family prenyltransferase [Euryarchaeota archaeon]|nr:UbiA family prenyltransferase [Euryarchaeota archaeon]